MQRVTIAILALWSIGSGCRTHRAVEPGGPADAPGASPAAPDAPPDPEVDRPTTRPAGIAQPDHDGFSFFVLGDTRSYPGRAEQNFRRMVTLDPHAIAVFNAGDITATGDAEGWALHAEAIARGGRGLIRRDLADWKPGAMRYVGVAGNHDVEDRAWRSNWNRYLPGQRHLGRNSEEGVFFALSYRKALFVVLDSAHPSEAQTAWLKKTLEQAPDGTRWRFAFFHHPIYPCSAKEPWVAGLPWARLFERHRVDIVFTGHTHTFERSCPMRRGRCQPGGVVYLNSSGGAAEARPVDRKRVARAGGDRYDCGEILAEGIGRWHHFCRIAVSDGRLRGSCYGHEGLDRPRASFTLTE